MYLYWIALAILAVGVSRPIVAQEAKGSSYCEFYDGEPCSESEEGCTKREECIADDPAARNHCFVMWHYNASTNTTTVRQKGCFLDGKECYDVPECIDKSNERKNNVFFCCCSGDMCNENFSWVPKPSEPVQEVEVEVTIEEEEEGEDLTILVLSLSVPGLVLVILGAVYWCMQYRNSKKYSSAECNSEAKTSCNPSLGPIDLLEVKARGNFGAVWKARMANDIVAAKVFSTQQEQSWQTERDVFTLPHMSHQGLLEFIGVERREDNLLTELWLVTAYHEKGSLCDYLKENVLSWSQLCRIAETMLRGLMHLHEEIPATNAPGFKPSVAHRDFKSHNILLKADLSACIADFGLSLIFHTDKPDGNVHGQVGTRRYMAPEVLQGAINFNRDSFLRIDMYACGLVLWELASRCTLQEASPEKYRLPFEDEVGPHPSLDDMLKIVIHKGERPRILPSWRNHPDLLVLCETMEECWDADPEARLSVACVLERVLAFTGNHVKSSSTSIWIEDNNTSVIVEEPSTKGQEIV